MDNPEGILQTLEEYSKLKPKDIPNELEDYLCYVAKTGDPVFQWSFVKFLFREKLLKAIRIFLETNPSTEISPCPNVEGFSFETMKDNLVERLESFSSAPFTVQRICELLINPKKEYKRIDKYLRAIEKNFLVVSTKEPGAPRRSESNQPELVLNGGMDTRAIELGEAIETVSSEGVNLMHVDSSTTDVKLECFVAEEIDMDEHAESLACREENKPLPETKDVKTSEDVSEDYSSKVYSDETEAIDVVSSTSSHLVDDSQVKTESDVKSFDQANESENVRAVSSSDNDALFSNEGDGKAYFGEGDGKTFYDAEDSSKSIEKGRGEPGTSNKTVSEALDLIKDEPIKEVLPANELVKFKTIDDVLSSSTEVFEAVLLPNIITDATLPTGEADETPSCGGTAVTILTDDTKCRQVDFESNVEREMKTQAPSKLKDSQVETLSVQVTSKEPSNSSEPNYPSPVREHVLETDITDTNRDLTENKVTSFEYGKESLVSRLDKLVSAMEPSDNHLRESVSAIESSDNCLGDIVSAIEPSGNHMGEPASAMESSDNRLGELASAMESSHNHLSELASTMEPSDNRLDDPASAIDPSDIRLGDLASALEPSDNHLSEPVSAIESSDNRLDDPTSAIESSDNRLGELASTIEPSDIHLGESVSTIESSDIRLGEQASVMEPSDNRLGEPVSAIQSSDNRLGGPAIAMEPSDIHLGEPVSAMQSSDNRLGGPVSALKPSDTCLGESTSAMEPSNNHMIELASTLEPSDNRLNETVSATEASDISVNEPVSAMEPSDNRLDEPVSAIESSDNRLGEPTSAIKPLDRRVNDQESTIEPLGIHVDVVGISGGPTEHSGECVDVVELSRGPTEHSGERVDVMGEQEEAMEVDENNQPMEVVVAPDGEEPMDQSEESTGAS
ncbi:unnamed protein product [Timema podura]|uniref:Serine/threonine-protein phosphatase 4 regulatory subunit 2 n=1 Tax=Timema podura TaxID=61482 RepID=A0ABN7P3T8_TIMPD|nr:unnamed protein product [Timema podura]